MIWLVELWTKTRAGGGGSSLFPSLDTLEKTDAENTVYDAAWNISEKQNTNNQQIPTSLSLSQSHSPLLLCTILSLELSDFMPYNTL